MWPFAEERTDALSAVGGALSYAVVDAPLAVLAGVASIISMLVGAVVGQASALAETISLADWWTLEHTLFALCLVQPVRIVVQRKYGAHDAALAAFSSFTMLFWGGCFLQLASAIQLSPAGTVFGGRMAMPVVGLLAAVILLVKESLSMLYKEIEGYGADVAAAGDDDSKMGRAFALFGRLANFETVMYVLIATFGIPYYNADERDWRSWLVVVPLLIIERQFGAYLRSENKSAELNGSPVVPAEEAEKEPEEKEKEPEDKEEKEEKPEDDKKESEGCCAGSTGAAAGACRVMCSAWTATRGFARRNVIDRVLALPWDCILDRAGRLAMAVSLSYCAWLLTEDGLSAVYLLTCVAPLAARIKIELSVGDGTNLLSERNTHLMREAAAMAMAALTYHLVRSHVA